MYKELLLIECWVDENNVFNQNNKNKTTKNKTKSKQNQIKTKSKQNNQCSKVHVHVDSTMVESQYTELYNSQRSTGLPSTFIHYGDLYSTSSRFLLRSVPIPVPLKRTVLRLEQNVSE